MSHLHNKSVAARPSYWFLASSLKSLKADTGGKAARPLRLIKMHAHVHQLCLPRNPLLRQCRVLRTVFRRIHSSHMDTSANCVKKPTGCKANRTKRKLSEPPNSSTPSTPLSREAPAKWILQSSFTNDSSSAISAYNSNFPEELWTASRTYAGRRWSNYRWFPACSIGAEVESRARRKGHNRHPARSAKKYQRSRDIQSLLPKALWTISGVARHSWRCQTSHGELYSQSLGQIRPLAVRKAAGKEVRIPEQDTGYYYVFDNGVTRTVLLLGNDDRGTGLLLPDLVVLENQMHCRS